MSKKLFTWLKFSTEGCLNIVDLINNLEFKNMEHEWKKYSLFLQAYKMLLCRQITLITISIDK